MKTVLLGTDFMYNSMNNLVPVQINTAVTLNLSDRIENADISYDLTDLRKLIIEKKFNKIYYIGVLDNLNEKLKIICEELNIVLSYYKIGVPSLTVPIFNDDDYTLVIRSAYDIASIVDEVYCRNRAKFLNLIKNENFSSQFVFYDYKGNLINTINKIVDNGKHPNFILKSIYPDYDREIYPKLFKISNFDELNDVILDNVTPNYFLMEYNFNNNRLYNNKIPVIRSLNLLFPPDLKSIHIGSYNKLCENKITKNPKYYNFMLKDNFKKQYLTSDDYNIDENFIKEYKNEKILSIEEINIMNNILSSVGTLILNEN